MERLAPPVTALTVKKRNGPQVPFFELRIFQAIESAFKEHLGIPQEAGLPPDGKAKMESVANHVVA